MAIKLAESKKYFSFTSKRNFFFIFATIVGLVIPFLKLDGRRLFMMSFMHRKLELMGAVFDSSQLYVLPLLIFMFAAWILMWTALGGRVWCGWGCPQTILRVVFRDFLQGFVFRLRRRNNKNKPLKLDTFSKQLRFVLSLIIWVMISLLVAANLSWYFIDPPEWFAIILSGRFDLYPFVYVFWLALAGFLVVDIVLIRENFCKYMCPYARIQSVFFDKDTALVVYDEKRGDNNDGSRGMRNFAREFDKSGDCTDCLACVKICPTGIDIRDGLQLGCIECLECVDACQPVMARRKRKNLIAWTTHSAIAGKKSRYIRPRPIIYGAIVVVCFALVFVLKAYKRDIKLNLNHDADTYQIYDEVVENSYTLLITNRTEVDKEFKLVLQSQHPLIMFRPRGNINLASDSILKKAVILQLAESEIGATEDSLLEFSIMIYDALDPTVALNKVKGKFFIPVK